MVKKLTFEPIEHDENGETMEISKIEDLNTIKSNDLSNSHFIVQDVSYLEEYYKNMDIKIFKDILFIGGKQCMIIKTWEKLQHVHTRDVCFIKTLRIFDNHNHLIR